MRTALHQPIGVFDAGIGSYAIVQEIHRHYPQQDILYLADRASFPYGAKTRDALKASVNRAITRLTDLGACTVVLASNAPSVMVLDDIRKEHTTPIFGVLPPAQQALEQSASGVVAILGVDSLINSAEIRRYVDSETQGAPIALVNASPLVQLVENGRFLSDPAATQVAMDAFMHTLCKDFPGLDTCTLSSTHLPWLRVFFERAAPDIYFLDPAKTLMPALRPFISSGIGATVCLATESEQLPVSGLQNMLKRLGVNLMPQLISL
jgi:glutamate racemase